MNIIEKISDIVWGNGLLFLLILTGVIMTVKLGFIQLRLPYLLIRDGKSENKGLSQFRTVCMSLGTAMGTGNIAGTASALALGGAGSVFWMCVSAFLGMSIVYAENVLSAKYSTDTLRGPMAYLENGLRSPVLAWIFALFCVLASFGMGGMVQVNTFTEALGECVNFSKPLVAVVIFFVIWITVSGGGQRISALVQYLLPTATVCYTAICAAVIFIFRGHIAAVLGEIFTQAFSFSSISGGIFGYAVSVGIRRGIFSNEAGLGSSPLLHSSAETTTPHTQGIWSMFEVFFDTVFCCTLTALAVMCGSEDFSIIEAASAVLGSHAEVFITAELGIFAFCTVTGWYYCGMTSFSHLTRGRYIKIYALLYSLIASIGTLYAARSLWALSDIFNGLMAFPNLLGILLLINKIDSDKRK